MTLVLRAALGEHADEREVSNWVNQAPRQSRRTCTEDGCGVAHQTPLLEHGQLLLTNPVQYSCSPDADGLGGRRNPPSVSRSVVEDRANWQAGPSSSPIQPRSITVLDRQRSY